MNCQKNLFSLKPGIHYLNCAYKAPLLKSAEDASIKALIRERNPADISEEDFFTEVSQVRESFGNIVNCNSANVALIPSAAYGFSSVLHNVKPKKSGNAITIRDEFPSGFFSLKRWCVTNNNELIIVEPDIHLNCVGENWNNKIIDTIDKNTSIVLISSVHWMNGLKFDLKRIGEKCAMVGAKFIVDGTQSVGALPLDVKDCKINALICTSYKWLFGPYSLGLAYIDDEFENGVALEETWMNRKNSKNFSRLQEYESAYQPGAGRYNVGEASNFILMPILKEGLKQISLWGDAEIQKYCKKLIEPLVEYFSTLQIELENEKYFANHLFSPRLPEEIDKVQLKKSLQRNNVIISLRGEFNRISVNVFNDNLDITKLIESIEDSRKPAHNYGYSKMERVKEQK